LIGAISSKALLSHDAVNISSDRNGGRPSHADIFPSGDRAVRLGVVHGHSEHVHETSDEKEKACNNAKVVEEVTHNLDGEQDLEGADGHQTISSKARENGLEKVAV